MTQITKVRSESNTMRCVALMDCVSEMPKKLKKATESMLPTTAAQR
jgi:hypothetical protein